MNSMTGFGRGSDASSEYNVSIEISSVNRKNLEVAASLPREWSIFEKDIQAIVKKYALRGKLYVSVQVTSSKATSVLSCDESVVNDALAQFKDLAEKTGVPFEPDANFLLRIIRMMEHDEGLPVNDDVLEVLKSVAEAAMKDLIEMRNSEGKSLQKDLNDRIGLIRQYMEDLEPHAAGTAQMHKDLMLERLKQSGIELDIDDDRVLREISIFADKCDVSEELTRLDSHLAQFKDSIKIDGLIGRKLDFLCQELNREINTIGSKANNIEVTKIVIEMKNELERIREQVQNVE